MQFSVISKHLQTAQNLVRQIIYVQRCYVAVSFSEAMPRVLLKWTH